MSKHKGKHNYATKEILDSLNTSALDGEKFLQKYAKPIGIFFAIVIIAVLGYVIYDNYVVTPKNIEASDLLVDAQNLYDEGKTDQALGGKSSGVSGFIDIAEEYGSTKAGKFAHLYAGIAEFKKGNYQNALDHFNQFDTSDKDLKAVKYGAIADTYAELNNTDEALNYMTKAANESSNAATVYQFSKKAGILAMSLNQNEKALEFFQNIKDKFPDVDASGEVDAYIERLKYATGKQ
ncbi:tetratricopeptide repeat protein [Apibacter sp. B3706]|uniref:tetratricopeptide repeat protein n=1 Tax=Apibacter TaxID=1778601 RepID=UPI000CF9EDAB|nr:MULTISPECIES: tetratricopeptide repeat protein [Apibacter]MCX8677758.1 tetratricopeptide repeat protein [Apibacter sp. B3919]MXO25034.1 tetratricopeptide repeat protein [Apibacter sp. B3924]MXO27215.1 tetratricopeptide repeat protein [Apibacter sp. B3813]MXO29028.1 tetratricopeptide repeat protein [Apibacter sp. B3913]MXO31191.1 tetratricopeptide repeat protein [Apibacter sp. B3912]